MTSSKVLPTVLPDWADGSLEEILRSCEELLEDTDFPTVHKWRENGGKVIGHFQVYFPEEIAHAAGMLPFKVRGAPVEPTQADSRFGSYLCSIIKTSLELALSQRIELDMFVTHPICDAARNLAGIWGRNFEYPCQILYLPQNANSNHAVEYLRAEYDRLKREIEVIAGREVTDDDLNHSIEVFNENRALLRALYAVKREQPWLLSADEAYRSLCPRRTGWPSTARRTQCVAPHIAAAHRGARSPAARSYPSGRRRRVLRTAAAGFGPHDQQIVLRRRR